MADTQDLDFLREDEISNWLAVRGWLLPSAARAFYKLARTGQGAGFIVEIGSFAGKSAVCLARGLQDSDREDAQKRMFAIDVSFQADFVENLRRFGVQDLVTALQGPSISVAETWKLPISFLYIDGDHGRAYAVADFFVWEPYVVPGGIIALDDTVGCFEGPSLQVQAALASGSFELLLDVGGVTFLRKHRELLPGISYHPLGSRTGRCVLAEISAKAGAMDPRMQIPVTPRSDPRSAEAEVLKLYAEELIPELQRLGDLRPDSLQWRPTVDYLKAILFLQIGRIVEANQMFQNLGMLEQNVTLEHYRVEVRQIALLRYAQSLDLLGQRAQAITSYQGIVESDAVPELVEIARSGLSAAFSRPATESTRLRREYVLDSPLDKYRVVE